MDKKFEVICVDDEGLILELYEEIFADSNYCAVCYDNAEDALKYIKDNQKNICAILSDFKMPKTNGFEFRKLINDSGLDIPFAIVTAFYDKEMAVEAMELKIVKFIDKPFDPESIISCVDEISASRLEALNEELEMVQDFLEETTPMLQEIEELILEIEEDPHSAEAINTYFRLLHTIKGTASCLGLLTISEFAHNYEDLINLVKKGEVKVNQKIIDIFLRGLDHLKGMYECARASKEYEHSVADIVKIFNYSSEDEGDAPEEKAVTQAGNDSGEKKDDKKKEEKIGVSVDVLEEFQELSGELTVLKNTVFKSLVKLYPKLPKDRDLEILAESLTEMHKVSSLLQGRVNEMKKVSLDNIFRSMKRVVRDSAKSTKKDVVFETKGEHLRVDNAIGKLLNGVLVHLLRNAVDHGIEPKEIREKNEKDPKGHITLSTYEEAENVIVEITDDGGGLDTNFLKDKAVEKGLYSYDELETMSDQKIYSIIFESGFSTAKQVTDISGRGVGMDMVRSSIEDMGGKIYIDSTLGAGTKFVLIIPIPRSVLIINSLMVEVNDNVYMIPLDEVHEVIRHTKSSTDKLHALEGARVLEHHGDLIPLIDIKNSLYSTENNNEELNIVVVSGEGFKYGIIVDEINDIEEVVVKKVNSAIGENPYFLGVTFIGDGELGFIFDVKSIAAKYDLNKDSVETNYDRFAQNNSSTSLDDEYVRCALASKESYCINLSRVDRLEEFNSSQIEYSGDVPLIRYRNSFLPLIFADEALKLGNSKEKLKTDTVINVVVVKANSKIYGIVVDALVDIRKPDTQLDESLIERKGFLGTITFDGKTFTVLDSDYIISAKTEKELEETGHLVISEAS